MTTRAPQPSAYARERLDELIGCDYSVEVLAVTEQGTVLVLMEGATPVFIAHAEDTPRTELSRQVFIVSERAERSFQRFLRSQVNADLRLVRMH